MESSPSSRDASYVPGNAPAELVAAARAIASVAARHAGDVDSAARFPAESVAAMRKARLLSAALPASLGGADANMQQLAAMCATIAQGCGASGMVLAMHTIQAASLARHATESPFFQAYLRALANEQRLIASVTSEVGIGGDTRSSICAVQREANEMFALEKDATTISYGVHADDLLVTARRAPDASPSDQVLVLLRSGDATLTCTGAWDTLGMRGTCSPSYRVAGRANVEQIVPGAFADASAQTMVPYSHILWSAVWLGVATDAVSRAAAYVRAEARKKPGTTPVGAARLAEASAQLQAMRQQVSAAAAEFDALGGRLEPLSSMSWALKLNNLKVSTSEAAPEIVHRALQITGIHGYRNDTPYSVGRQYRDVLSASLMIANDRIAAKSASMLLVLKDDA